MILSCRADYCKHSSIPVNAIGNGKPEYASNHLLNIMTAQRMVITAVVNQQGTGDVPSTTTFSKAACIKLQCHDPVDADLHS